MGKERSPSQYGMFPRKTWALPIRPNKYVQILFIPGSGLRQFFFGGSVVGLFCCVSLYAAQAVSAISEQFGSILSVRFLSNNAHYRSIGPHLLISFGSFCRATDLYRIAWFFLYLSSGRAVGCVIANYASYRAPASCISLGLITQNGP